jgi:hypothetical protein
MVRKASVIQDDGKAYAYMISRRLGLKFAFEELELGNSDSINFDAQMPHRLWTIGNKVAEAVWGGPQPLRRQAVRTESIL